MTPDYYQCFPVFWRIDEGLLTTNKVHVLSVVAVVPTRAETAVQKVEGIVDTLYIVQHYTHVHTCLYFCFLLNSDQFSFLDRMQVKNAKVKVDRKLKVKVKFSVLTPEFQ